MTVTPTYPGVYLSETASLPRAVVPATTNLTAFIGVFERGPVNEALLVTSWAGFATIYGGLVPSSLATYGVWQFFQNGGIGAWIVRLAPPGSAAATATLGPFTVRAMTPGAWANGIEVSLLQFDAGFGSAAGTYANVVVTSAGPNPQPLESLIDLPASDLHELAAEIGERSEYVTAEVAGSPKRKGAKIGTLAGGADGAFDGAGFKAAVEAQLGSGPTTPLLDGIAPQIFNLLAIPDAATLTLQEQTALYALALGWCAARHAFLLVDPPPPSRAPLPAGWGDTTVDDIGTDPAALAVLTTGVWAQTLLTPEHDAGAVYYPWVQIPDPANRGRPRYVPPSGTVAGVFATSDLAGAVWKAPAGTTAVVQNVLALADATLDDEVQHTLERLGVNCLRTLPIYGNAYGNVVWGGRTLAGTDLVASPWKYVSVRRLANFIEESLQQSLRWAVFELNGAELWASVSSEVGPFMAGLYAAGAFGDVPQATAYSVVCDGTTTMPADEMNGVVNVNVRFIPDAAGQSFTVVEQMARTIFTNIQLNAAPAPADRA